MISNITNVQIVVRYKQRNLFGLVKLVNLIFQMMMLGQHIEFLNHESIFLSKLLKIKGLDWGSGDGLLCRLLRDWK